MVRVYFRCVIDLVEHRLQIYWAIHGRGGVGMGSIQPANYRTHGNLLFSAQIVARQNGLGQTRILAPGQKGSTPAYTGLGFGFTYSGYKYRVNERRDDSQSDPPVRRFQIYNEFKLKIEYTFNYSTAVGGSIASWVTGERGVETTSHGEVELTVRARSEVSFGFIAPSH